MRGSKSPAAQVPEAPLGEGKLSPQIREATGDRAAIRSIPSSLIEPFLSQPLVLEPRALDGAARIIATQEGRVYVGRGDDAYTRGIADDSVKHYSVFRPLRPLFDPDDVDKKRPIAYEAKYLGAASMVRPGEVAKVHIDSYKEEIGIAGIPFALEGGKSFYRREEIAAVVAALSAIDDPGDAVSVVAALKSVLFGLSDLELLEAAESGLRFDDLPRVPEESALHTAARLLLRLHGERHGRPLAETLGDLLSSTQAVAAAENEAVVNPVQGVANLERLLVLARDLDREGLSFREAVARLRRRTEEDGPEPAAWAEEELLFPREVAEKA